MIAWLLGKIGLGGVEKAVEGVAGIVTQHMKDNEAADELKAKLKANADTVYAGIRKAMAGSRNWFVADATVLVLWVVAIALALYLLPRYGLATYDWMQRTTSRTGELEDYPVGASRADQPGRAHRRLRRAASGGQALREEVMLRLISWLPTSGIRVRGCWRWFIGSGRIQRGGPKASISSTPPCWRSRRRRASAASPTTDTTRQPDHRLRDEAAAHRGGGRIAAAVQARRGSAVLHSWVVAVGWRLSGHAERRWWTLSMLWGAGACSASTTRWRRSPGAIWTRRLRSSATRSGTARNRGAWSE